MWYALQVKTGQEQRTLDKIKRSLACAEADAQLPVHVEVFIPRREAMRHRGSTWERVPEILFPGYLFVKTDEIERLDALLSTVPFFARVLGAEGCFSVLTDDEVSFISVFGGREHLIRMSEGVIEGDEVRVLRGPLKDHDGIIKKVDRHKRAAYVEMWMLGRLKTIKLGLEIVHKRA